MEDIKLKKHCENCKFDKVYVMSIPCITCQAKSNWAPKEKKIKLKTRFELLKMEANGN
jgi:hypothetical protein